MTDPLTLNDILDHYQLQPDGDVGWQGYAKRLPNPGDWPFALIVTNDDNETPKQGEALRVTLHGGEACAHDGSSLLACVELDNYNEQIQLNLLDKVLNELHADLHRLSGEAVIRDNGESETAPI